jgi:hypothetical protein
MATLHQLLAAVQGQVDIACTGLSVFDAGIIVETGLDWPPMNTLMNNVKLKPPTALVSIFDHKYAHDSTRWAPSAIALTIVPATIVSAPSQQLLPPGATATVTVGGTVTPGDAISLLAFTRFSLAVSPADGTVVDTPGRAVVYLAQPTDSAAQVAAGLAGQVATDPNGSGIAQWISVSVAGPVVSVTNLLQQVITVESYTGNGGTLTTEIGRRLRQVQVTVWAASTEIRDVVGDPIEAMIAQMEVFRGDQGQFSSGLPLADGSSARIMTVNDFLLDDPTLSDTYRRDFILSADYPVTVQDKLYAVLAPILSYNLSY